TLAPITRTARRPPSTPTRRTRVRRARSRPAGDQLAWNRARGRRPERVLILGGFICRITTDRAGPRVRSRPPPLAGEGWVGVASHRSPRPPRSPPPAQEEGVPTARSAVPRPRGRRWSG